MNITDMTTAINMYIAKHRIVSDYGALKGPDELVLKCLQCGSGMPTSL